MSRRTLVSAVVAGALIAGGLPALAASLNQPTARPTIADTALQGVHPGLARLGQARHIGNVLSGIATFDGKPTSGVLTAIRALGVKVQPTRNLPLAYVLGTTAQLRTLVSHGLANDVYPDEQLHWESTDSNATIGADKVQKMGITGKGVGIAIVDSGIDATQSALKNRVTHNVKIIDEEYAQQPAGSLGGPWIIPVDQGPYDNSDSASGHGTHCAGIAAADGTGDPKLVGVAPGANLLGYSTGEAVFITAVVGAFDDILTHHKAWNIRVVSNSWGSSFRLFDPNDPINIASKKLHDAGLTVVFAAGNDTEPMTQNPYSVAPWVIGVASGTYALTRSDFSSGGVANDDSQAQPLQGTEVHQHFTGTRIGLYHPDVTAPGTDIVSTGTPTGTIVTESPGSDEATASGTSMATPHVAGAAALLLQARPSLTPDQVAQVLQVTARQVRGNSPFFYTGYGYIDMPAAIALVRSKSFSARTLATLQQRTDAKVLASTPYRTLSVDYWQFPASIVTVGGVPDSRTYTIDVDPAKTQVLQAVVAYPSLSYVGINQYDYGITVTDAKGKVVATSTPSSTAGQSSLLADLRGKGYAAGTWTISLSGNLGTSDNDTLEGKNVALTVAQLVTQKVPGASGPVFVPTGKTTLLLQPGTATQVPSPEGCATASDVPSGGMAGRKSATCESGQVGYATTNYDAAATFTSGPLTRPVTLGNGALLRQWLVDPANPAYSNAFTAWTIASLDAIGPGGKRLGIASIDGKDHPIVTSNDATAANLPFTIAPVTVPAGYQLELSLTYGGVYDSAMRLLWGAQYDSGITLTTGVLK
jgi:serine protease AprX